MGGKAGVSAWRGEADCPNVVANSTDREVAISTFKLPPKSVSVHPGPNNGVAVGWRSPVKGTVRITGGVTDADPQGGDGIAWAIDLRKAGGRRELASGDFPNGGAQKFDQGKGAAALATIEVEPGDGIDLAGAAEGELHSATRRSVDLTIALADGSKAWNLAGDVAGDLLQDGKGNPHADRYGNAGVWPFWDMADSRRGQRSRRPRPGGVGPGGGRDATARPWNRRPASSRRRSRGPTPRSPFWIKNAEDEAALPGRRRDDAGAAGATRSTR